MEDIKNKEYPAPGEKKKLDKLNNTTARETADHISATNTTSEYKPAGKKPGKLGAH